jgi:hypothetical protein
MPSSPSGGRRAVAPPPGAPRDDAATGMDTSARMLSDTGCMAEPSVIEALPRMSREEARTLLRREFKAESGTFTRALRSRLTWEREGFAAVVRAMHAICVDCADHPQLERWLAEGFWQSSTFITTWSGNREFPRTEPAEYYQRAWDQLNDLTGWFFGGISPYTDEFPFAPVR